MPVIHPFYESTAPNAVAVAVQTNSVDLKHWAKNQIRFPKRDVVCMPAHRQLEHFSVDHALQRLGLEAADVHVVHDDNLKPHIERPNSTAIHQAISIAHQTDGDVCHALVALGSSPIGCDIECERISLPQIAHRVMSTEEGDEHSSLAQLCAIWTVKESMFKALGPQLDFRRDLRVILPPDWNPDIETTWTIEGLVRGHRYAWEIWNRVSPITNARIWMCCGPMTAPLTLGDSDTPK